MARVRIIWAAAATLLAVALVAALTVEPSGDDGEQRVAAGGGPTTTWAEATTTTEAPTTTTAPVPTTAAPAPAAVAAPKPAAPKAAKPKGAGTSSSLGPRPPGSAVFPYAAGRSEWSATSNGITMSLRMQPAAPRTGEAVTFTLTATSAPDRICCGLYMVYGDGGTSGSTTCGSGPGTATKQLTHVYNKAGRWEFLFGAHDGPCGGDARYGSIYGWVSIAPGTTTSQGPSQPTIKVGDNNLQAGYSNDDRSWVTVAGTARDDDGFIARFVIDWGDGSPLEQVRGDEAGCRPTNSGWPAASYATMPTKPPATHRYAAPGSYEIRVTAYSTGCDGRDEQHAVDGFTWVY